MQPKVIILEGCDYTGKTSIAKHLFEKLDKLYPGQVVIYRSPGGTDLGEKIRDIARIEAKSLLTQTFAYLTAISSVYEAVQNDLKEGKIVILDRWYYSTLAYQILPMRHNENTKQAKVTIEKMVKQLFNFDNTLMFYLTLPFNVMVDRMNVQSEQRLDTKDRFELSDTNYKKEVWSNYNYILETLIDGDSVFNEKLYNKKSSCKIYHIETIEKLEDVKSEVWNKLVINL